MTWTTLFRDVIGFVTIKLWRVFLHLQLLDVTQSSQCNKSAGLCQGILSGGQYMISGPHWFGSITQKETLRLNRVVKTASRIIGRDLPSLEILYQQRLLGRATLISQDSSHPAHDLFEPLPSIRLFRLSCDHQSLLYSKQKWFLY